MPPRTYTAEQIEQIYDRIDLPDKWRLNPGQAKDASKGSEALGYLKVLQRYVMASIPFENLELHYSRTQKIDIHPEVLFSKIVTQSTGRGGYCMENNSFFATVLRTIGFKLYSTGGRTNSAVLPDGEVGEKSFYYGFGHMINIVVIDGARYLVDVGFGAGGPTEPMKIEDGEESFNKAHGRSLRLKFDSIPENESDSKLWILERKTWTGDWSPCYCFPDQVEFFHADFLSLNDFPSTNQKSFYKQKIVVVRHVLSKDGSEIVGEVVLLDRETYGRDATFIYDCRALTSEADRIKCLEEIFDIKLDPLQQSGIMGMPSAIDDR